MAAMEILKEINKEVFEKYVPAAKMPQRNTSVYERMTALLESAYGSLCSAYLGEAKEKAEENARIKDEVLRIVCIEAFVGSVRSLDLVLTATGFGIVSTESTAPASAARVQALVDEMRLQACLAAERLVELLVLVEGWADTPQARQRIPVLFWKPSLMRSYCMLPLTAENWQTVLAKAMTFDSFVRNVVSTEYMDHLLQHLRHGTMGNDDIIVMDMCNRLTATAVNVEPVDYQAALGAQADAIVRHLEKYTDKYPVYGASDLYARKHHSTYENRKQDPTFFFV